MFLGRNFYIFTEFSAIEACVWGMYGGVFLLHGGEFQRPWKRCSMIAKWPLEVEIAMGTVPMPISVSSPCFALRYEVPKFLPRGGHLCMAVLTIVVLPRYSRTIDR